MGNTNDWKYKDIIDLPHHISEKRRKMPMIDRAAQFSPFAALTGYDAAIQETGRLTEERRELSEESKAELDRKQQILLQHISEHPEITVTYFVHDDRKPGGAYVTVTGRLKRMDAYMNCLILDAGARIPAYHVVEIQSGLFGSVGE